MSLTGQDTPFSMQKRVRGPWRKYLDSLEPLRPDLHRYCCGLTGNVWDGEDLVQDVLLRVFGLLGKIDANLKNPRTYLIRTATHLWIDRMRRANIERAYLEDEAHHSEIKSQSVPADSLEVSEAAETFLDVLAPQERAAILLKDIFDLSLAETAALLKTSVGAVKSALHRGRNRLQENRHTKTLNAPPAELVQQFMEALSNKDMTRLQELCMEGITVELVGGAMSESFEQSRNFFKHAHMVFPALGFGTNPWWKTFDYDGETIVVGFRTLDGIEGVNEVHRIEEHNGQISAIRCYCFCPDTLRTVADGLGMVSLDRPYRSPSMGTVIKSLPAALIGKVMGDRPRISSRESG